MPREMASPVTTAVAAHTPICRPAWRSVCIVWLWYAARCDARIHLSVGIWTDWVLIGGEMRDRVPGEAGNAAAAAGNQFRWLPIESKWSP
jgi:hypothetical protein